MTRTDALAVLRPGAEVWVLNRDRHWIMDTVQGLEQVPDTGDVLVQTYFTGWVTCAEVERRGFEAPPPEPIVQQEPPTYPPGIVGPIVQLIDPSRPEST